jgi:hydroxymethylbilane synthase
LPQGARAGTASARRQAWLRHFRPDLEVSSLRGNVPTRLRRLADGDFDAILLAGAGIARLEEASDVLDEALAGLERQRLDPEHFVPAPAQGALAVQCRAGDDNVRLALEPLEDNDTRTAVELERRALALAEGGCDAAFGAYARSSDEGFALTVMTERHGRIESAEVKGNPESKLEIEAMQAIDLAAGGAT